MCSLPNTTLFGSTVLVGTLPVSSAYAGVEFQPTSNLSLSLGVGVVQQTGRIDSEINSLPGASSFSVGGRRY